MADKPYPTDLSDAEWALIKPFLVRDRGRRGQRKHDPRRIVDGCFYVLRGGIAWRLMPHDLPDWDDVYSHLQVAQEWHVGADQPGSARTRPRRPRPQAPAERGGDRQPVGQDHRGRR